MEKARKLSSKRWDFSGLAFTNGWPDIGLVFLIWDGHPIHNSLKVKKCIESFDGQLKVFILPLYSPELNPAEQVWNNVKSHCVG